MKIATYALVSLLASGIAVACSSSTPSPGVPNEQANTSCLAQTLHCSLDSECCSQWCANNVCAQRQP